MKESTYKAVKITQLNKSFELSKGQKLFNRLIKQIEDKRQCLLSWENMMPLYQKGYANDFTPLMKSFEVCQTELVYLLDKAYDERGLNKKEKTKISHIICPIVTELLNTNRDVELKAIYNKHSKSDFDEEEEEAKAVIQIMAEEVFGIEIDDNIDYTSPDAVFRHFSDKIKQKLTEDEKLEQARGEKRSKRKKSEKTLQKEAREKEDAKNVSQSIREVYRKLASALHPDREQDPIERDRKTALMQQVNMAYERRNLLGLLTLQLEIEQIDQAAISTIAEDRLQHYNKILAEQHADLKNEIFSVEAQFKMRFNIHPEFPISHKTALNKLRKDIDEMRNEVSRIKKDISLFQEVKHLKAWLKLYNPQPFPSGKSESDHMDLGALFGW